MKTLNADMDKFLQYIVGKKLYIYGLGDIFQGLVKKEIYADLQKNVAGYIDNRKAGGKIEVLGQKFPVYAVEDLKEREQGIVLLCSTRYIDEMYQILCAQNFPDTIECFVLPLIWAVSGGQDDDSIKRRIENSNSSRGKIEKKIHCFWFSNDRKPEAYQRCMDSWKRICPDYEIIEWNARNYDWEKNRFMKQAFEKKKWAFVSDFARLDVIYHYGGIYLDMDVELLKSLDPWLQFSAFFNFGTQNDIDLGSGFGSIKMHPVLRTLLELYENADFLDKNGEPMTERYMQPQLIRERFPHMGIHMNGNMQLVNDVLVLPRKYHTPVDDFFLQNFVQCNDTRSIHHYNAGWVSKEMQDERERHLAWIDLARERL